MSDPLIGTINTSKEETTMTTPDTTADRIARIPGDLIDRMQAYFNDKQAAFDLEAQGGRPDFAGLDDEAAELVDLIDEYVCPTTIRDHVDWDATRTGTPPQTVTAVVTVTNIVDDDHLEELVNVINTVGYAANTTVLRNSEMNPVQINELADIIVNHGEPRTVQGLHLDYSDDTPGHLQTEVDGETEEPLYAYQTAAGLRELEALFGALAVRISDRERRIYADEVL